VPEDKRVEPNQPIIVVPGVLVYLAGRRL